MITVLDREIEPTQESARNHLHCSRGMLRVTILCRATMNAHALHRFATCPSAAPPANNLFRQPTLSLSTDLAANVKPDPGTLMLPMDLGERATLTRTPWPNARSGLCGCPNLRPFPSMKYRR